MCLTIWGNNNNKANRKCAIRDIVCYKVFRIDNGQITSMYHKTNRPWKIGVTKMAEKAPFIYCGEVHGGYFHSYSDWVDAQDVIKRSGYGSLKIYKCIIPKGSAYYQNYDGVIVSESIIVTGEEISRKDISENK